MAGAARATYSSKIGRTRVADQRTSLLASLLDLASAALIWLAPLLDLAAAVDDEGHFLAVFHRLDGRTFGGRFDFSDL